jgi:thioredoxin reductase
MLNIPGEDLPKVRHYYKDPHFYAKQHVIVVGANNSSVDVALETYRKGAQVSMVIRESEIGERVKYWVRPDIVNRIKEGSIKAYFNSSLAEIRARLTQQDTKQQNKNAPQQGDRSTYPHWNMEEGTIATVRFLPDADPNNPFFWVEKQVIKLTFNGVLGDPNSKRVEVSVPCI